MSKWEELYEGDIEKSFISKQTFHFKQGKFDFDYKYDIDFIQVDEDNISIEVLLVPLFKELHNDHKEMIMSLYDLYSFDTDGALYNVKTELECPLMLQKEYVEEELDLWSEKGEEFIKQHLAEIGNKLQEIDLNKDKALNRQIPSVVFELNGWDLLNYILFNEKKVYEPKQREE